jgi:hypothetical protein
MASLKPAPPPEHDVRLYAPFPEGWQAQVKQGWDKQYCYYKHPGEDHFHVLVAGELYLQHGDEKVCLSCALRNGILTTDRLYWQHLPRKAKSRLV